MSTYHTVNFVSTTQYYLTITGGNGVAYGTASPTSDNWYDSGSSTTVSSNWVWNTVAGQSRTAVTNWQLDTVNQNPVRQGSGTLTTSSVLMSSYHTVNFVSTTQYYLTTSGGNGVITSGSQTSDSWYDSGSSATATSNYVWNFVGGQSRNNLYRWNLDGGSWSNIARANTGTYTTSSITMSAYHTVNFGDTVQYYLTVNGGNSVTYGTPSPTSDNWYDTGTSTIVSSNWVWNTIPGQSRTAVTNWQLDSVNQNPPRQGTGTLATSSISMSTYHTVNFASVTQYYLTVTGGNGVTYSALSPTSDNWYDAGTSTTVSSAWVWNTVPSVSRTAITNYAIDGANQNPARQGTGTLTTSSVSMSTYHAVAFASATQYYLTNGLVAGSVSSVTASPTSDSWYDSGSGVSVVLNYVWGASSSTRSNLFSYTVDAVTTNVARSGSGSFTVPTITMSAAHSVGDAGVTQYFLTNTLISGSVNSITASPTADSWYDSGSGVNVVLNYVWGAVGRYEE